MTDIAEIALLACFDKSIQGVALFNRQDLMVYANANFVGILVFSVVDSLIWEEPMQIATLKKSG